MEIEIGAVLDAVRTFAKRHATCGGLSFDLPELPRSTTYRVVMACTCGDTLEEWVEAAWVSRRELAARLARLRPASRAPTPPLPRSA